MKSLVLLLLAFAPFAGAQREVLCKDADLGFKAGFAGFHVSRCIATVDGKELSLLTVDITRTMGNGMSYPGSGLRHLEFTDPQGYADIVCASSEKHDPDRLWKQPECKWIQGMLKAKR